LASSSLFSAFWVDIKHFSKNYKALSNSFCS
jgi:hypothetical protein